MNNDILLIILTLIFVAILIGVNIYILKIYTHSDERGVLSVLYCKIFIILGSTLFQAQALMVPLDVANKSSDLALPGGIDMKSFWYFLFIIVLGCICFLFPFVLFFYEADSQEGICKKILKSIAYTLVANIVSILLIFITYNFWRYADLPTHAISA
jgi:magnesium-transporting ATPase (P-type)